MPFDSTKVRKAKGKAGIDPNIYNGPKTMPQDLPKLTNRELRNKEFMSLLRRLKPHLRKAVNTAIQIMDNDAAPFSVRLAASKFIVDLNKSTLNDLYSDKYDDEAGEAVQEDAPKFSLVMLRPEPEKGLTSDSVLRPEPEKDVDSLADKQADSDKVLPDLEVNK